MNIKIKTVQDIINLETAKGKKLISYWGNAGNPLIEDIIGFIAFWNEKHPDQEITVPILQHPGSISLFLTQVYKCSITNDKGEKIECIAGPTSKRMPKTQVQYFINVLKNYGIIDDKGKIIRTDLVPQCEKCHKRKHVEIQYYYRGYYNYGNFWIISCDERKYLQASRREELYMQQLINEKIAHQNE